jgi:septal ring factor EnvC (AmiA/AmiB activator)
MKSVAVLVAALLFSGIGSVLAGPSIVKKSQELTQIQSRIKQVNQNMEQIKTKREALLALLRKIEKQYGTTAGSLRELTLQINQKQQRLKDIRTEMKKRHTELVLQNKELSKQVKASFVMGKKEKLKLLLNQQNPVLASRMMVYYDYLNKTRLKKLANLKNNIATLKKLEQEKRRDSLILEKAVKSHQTEQIDLGKTRKQREQLLAKLNQDYNLKSQQLSQLKDGEKKLQTLIDALEKAAVEQEKLDRIAITKAKLAPKTVAAEHHTEVHLDVDGNPITVSVENNAVTDLYTVSNKPFAELKGQLPWPVRGTIIKKFGSPRSETSWDGVLISAREGTEIRAVTDGRVVFADWLRGYGLLMIIDHGGGYMTLYAFNQSLYKKLGERVNAGSIIGAVGNSDGREESGLYFGVRSKGKAVDPVLWCRK